MLDGAMGTAIQDLDLDRGRLRRPRARRLQRDTWSSPGPDVDPQDPRDYLAAGADIVETNTFGGTPLVLAEYGLADEGARDQRRGGAPRARSAADEMLHARAAALRRGLDGPHHQGHLGHRRRHVRRAAPSTSTCRPRVSTTAASTTSCSRPARTRATSRPASASALHQSTREPAEPLPIAVSGTIEPMGTMLAGQSVEALAASLEHVDLLYLGLNCATGPEFMTDHIRTLAAHARVPRRLRAERGPPRRERPATSRRRR